jgi:replicative superfamily II helicase
MPAKNIVLCHPKTGHDIARLSLLNLAGRAGRLMKDHYGKIYCIDMAEWKVNGIIGSDAFEDSPEFVQSSVDRTLNSSMELLVGYLDNPYHQGVNRSIKRLATSLMMKYLKKRNRQDVVSFLQRSKNVPFSDIERIVNKIENACQLMLPDETVLKNRTFDPRFQNDLYIALK